MPDREEDRQRIAAASEELLRFPGVHTVYFGPRYRNGRETGEQALCAFVYRKKRLEDIAPIARVPREIFGIPTDVIEADPPRRMQGDDPTHPTEKELSVFDKIEYSEIRGGIFIESAEEGTLGCIARATDAANNGRLVLLANQHVLTGKCTGVGANVYQPDVSCCCCGRKIAKVLRTRNTMTGAFFKNQPTVPNVDCGIALLNPGIRCFAEIQVGAGAGTAVDLVSGVLPRPQITDTPPLPVKKRGLRTGQTLGTLVSAQTAHAPAGNKDKSEAFRNQLLLRPNVPPGASTGTFRFSVSGDSGAVVMTQTGDQVVGLLWGSLRARPLPGESPNLVVVSGVATNIHDVIAAMQIAIETTSTAGQVITVPAPAAIAPADAFGQPQPQPIQRSMLAEAQFQIEQTVYGRQYADTVRRHHAEVRALVATNRRVGAIWKRYGGQSVLQAILDAVGRPDEAIPEAVGSRRLTESVARIAAILRRHGSAALRRDIAEYERIVGGVCGCTYNQLLARLRAGEPVAEHG